MFVAGTDASGLAFLKEARRQQLDADLVGGDGWQTLAPSALAEGVYVGAPFSAQDPRPEVQAFVAAYQRKYNAIPDGNAALAYDATKLLAARGRAGRPEPHQDPRLSRRPVRRTSRSTASPARSAFSPDGDPIGKGIVMTRVHQGALQVEAAK